MKNKKVQKSKACPAKLQRSGGFSLIELLVAIGILILVIGGAVGVETQNIRVASTTKHKIQAAALGNQTINQIRTIRDTEILKGKTGNEIWEKLDGSDVNIIRKLVLPDGSTEYNLEQGDTKTTLNGVEYTIEITVED